MALPKNKVLVFVLKQYEGIDMKMNFSSHANKTHFHKKGFALSL